MSKKKRIYPPPRPCKCDYPGCPATDAQRIDIKTSWFRGDDIVMNACREHRKPAYESALLGTEKARKQE